MNNLNHPSAVAIVVVVIALAVIALLLAGQAATVPVLIGLGLTALHTMGGRGGRDNDGGAMPR